MCAGCEADVVQAGEYLDQLIEMHRHVNDVHRQHESSAMQCIGLACAARDSYLEDQGIEQLQQICLGFAVAVHRLAVLQQINGGAL